MMFYRFGVRGTTLLERLEDRLRDLRALADGEPAAPADEYEQLMAADAMPAVILYEQEDPSQLRAQARAQALV